MIDNPVFLKELRTKFRWRVSRRLKFAVAALVIGVVMYAYFQVFSLMLRLGGEGFGPLSGAHLQKLSKCIRGCPHPRGRFVRIGTSHTGAG